MRVLIPRIAGSWITYGLCGLVCASGVIAHAFGGLMLVLLLGMPLVAQGAFAHARRKLFEPRERPETEEALELLSESRTSCNSARIEHSMGKQILILAGPNGAGKTTFAREFS